MPQKKNILEMYNFMNSKIRACFSPKKSNNSTKKKNKVTK